MIVRFAQWQGGEPVSLAADATYGNGDFLQWLLERGVTPYMRTRDSALRKNNPGYHTQNLSRTRRNDNLGIKHTRSRLTSSEAACREWIGSGR